MKPLHLIIAALLACPLPAFALGVDGSIGNSSRHRDDTAVIEVASTDDSDYFPMLASAINDPYASAADLGLASPGSSWRLPKLGGE